ncbi:MAG: Rhodanese-related sulfurtransferase [Bacteroidetes bacterium]|nr:Rhodanese-related sulfurtransferase [Bacteroidota bacterium]
MTGSQIVLYGLLTLALVLYLRRWLVTRSVPQYTPAEVAERMKAGAVMLDVRTEMERNGGSIKGSKHIPLHMLSRRMDELKRLKENEVICYCRSGNRSVSAAVVLRKQGFRAASMKGEIEEWNHS